MNEVFISHIALEAELALVLKEQIERAFPKGKVRAFVSSSPDDIKAGQNSLRVIKRALTSSKVLLVVCSQISIYSPWIFFEAGYGWSHELPVLPICHGKQNKGKLPLPLGLFQALQISNPTFSEELIARLAKILRVTRARRIDYVGMARKLVAAAQSVAAKVKILEVIEAENRWVNNIPLKLALKVMLPETTMLVHLDSLEEAGYINKAWARMSNAFGYSLTNKGERLLQQGYNY